MQLRYSIITLLLLFSVPSLAQYEFLLNKSYAERYQALDSLFYTPHFWNQDSVAVYHAINGLKAIAKNEDDEELYLEAELIECSFKLNSGRHNSKEYLASMHRLLDIADKKKIAHLQIRTNFFLSAEYHANDDYGQSFEHQVRMYQLMRETPDAEFPIKKSIVFYIGKLYYSFEDYNTAEKYLHEALIAPQTNKKTEDIDILNTIGLIKRKTRNYDSATFYFDRVALLAGQQNNTVWVGIANGNKGITLYYKGQFRLSIPLLQADIQASMLRKDYRNAINSVIKLADIYRIQGRTDSARYYATLARRIVNTTWHPYEHLVPLYKLLEQLEITVGNEYLARRYADSALTAKDSLNSRRNVLLLVNARNKVQEAINKSRIEQLRAEKKFSVLQRNSIIAGLTLLLTIGLLILNAQKIRRKRMEEEKLHAESQLENARKRLATFSQTIREKNMLLETSAKEINRLSNVSPDEDDELPIELMQQLQKATILTDDEWDEFRDLFGQVHSGYLFRLKSKIPELTPSETRFIALYKLKFSNKEIANVLGVSPATCRNYKSRLIKKLSMNDSEKFAEMVDNI